MKRLLGEYAEKWDETREKECRANQGVKGVTYGPSSEYFGFLNDKCTTT